MMGEQHEEEEQQQHEEPSPTRRWRSKEEEQQQQAGQPPAQQERLGGLPIQAPQNDLGVGLAVFRFCCVGAPRAVRKKSGQWLR